MTDTQNLADDLAEITLLITSSDELQMASRVGIPIGWSAGTATAESTPSGQILVTMFNPGSFSGTVN
jgi:hypothetical protein